MDLAGASGVRVSFARMDAQFRHGPQVRSQGDFLMLPVLRRLLTVLILAVAGLAMHDASLAQPGQTRRLIELEVVADQRGELGLQHEWMEALQRVGADRVRVATSARPGGPAVEELRTGETVVVQVRGMISGRRLKLPGGEFGIGDTDGIATLLRRIRDDGAQMALTEKMGFGLTAEQLVALHEELATPVAMGTFGQPVTAVIEGMRGALRSPLALAPEVVALLEECESPVQDELRGMSVGTALAAVARPLGLVLVPVRPQGGVVQLGLVPYDRAAEHWPVGWPVEEDLRKVAPAMFQAIDVEIRSYTLADALAAIAARMEMPLLYDQNSLAMKEVDPAAVRVELVQKKLTLNSIVTKLCAQARPALAFRVRRDEAGKPFLWVY